jgi:hypothetical protein
VQYETTFSGVTFITIHDIQDSRFGLDCLCPRTHSGEKLNKYKPRNLPVSSSDAILINSPMRSKSFCFLVQLSLTTLSKLSVKIAISHNLTTSYNSSPIVGTRVFPTRSGEDLISPQKKNPQSFYFFKDWVDQNVLQKVFSCDKLLHKYKQ